MSDDTEKLLINALVTVASSGFAVLALWIKSNYASKQVTDKVADEAKATAVEVKRHNTAQINDVTDQQTDVLLAKIRELEDRLKAAATDANRK